MAAHDKTQDLGSVVSLYGLLHVDQATSSECGTYKTQVKNTKSCCALCLGVLNSV